MLKMIKMCPIFYDLCIESFGPKEKCSEMICGLMHSDYNKCSNVGWLVITVNI